MNFISLLVSLVSPFGGADSDRSHFVELKKVSPTILYDIRYGTENNFLGKRVDGYSALKCYLLPEAARALARVQEKAKKQGYTLKVYDCFRPQRAVDHFVRWAKDSTDTRQKKRFYPAVKKTDLFKNGYIASRSGHSRGATVDITLVARGASKGDVAASDCRLGSRYDDDSLEMGTAFDCFDPLSHTENRDISNLAKKNRKKLRDLMQSEGFHNYEKEWWHYTLQPEPFPERYFDFELK